MEFGKYLAALSSIAVASAQPAQAAKEPLVLTPVTEWTTSREEDVCVLRRDFQSGKKTLTLEFSSFSYDPFFQFRLVSKGIPVREADHVVGYTYSRFEPDETFGLRENGYNEIIKGGKRGVLFTGSVFPNALLRQRMEGADGQFEALLVDYPLRDRREMEVTALRIGAPYPQDILIETGELHTPMSSFRSCIDDLVRTEGLDPEKLATLSKAPEAKDVQAWADQLAAKVPLVTTYSTGFHVIEIRLTVDPFGKPIDCRLRDNMKDVNFYRSVCKTSMDHLEFEPALDSAGKPTTGYHTTRLLIRGY